MKILLLGANGQLGQTLLQHTGLREIGPLIAATRDGRLNDGRQAEPFDLADPDQIQPALDRLKPELIINAAAYTSVDRAEQEESLANRTNGEALGQLGAWAARNAALLIHYSTDYVFDGQQAQPYAVDALTAPLGAYGRSKLLGELALRESGAQHLLFRTAWVYAAHGRNFLKTMLRLATERDELRIVDDQFGSPTSTNLIADGTTAALRRWLESTSDERASLNGTYHLVASGATSWHGFASAIMKQAMHSGLLARTPQISAISTLEFPTPARRPAWSVLDNLDFQRRFGFVLPDWQDGLSFVLDELAHSSA